MFQKLATSHKCKPLCAWTKNPVSKNASMHSNICSTHNDALPHNHACNVCNNLIQKCGGGWLIHPDEIIQLLCEWMWCLLVSQTVYKHIMNFTCRLLQTYTNSASWNGGRLRVNEHTLLKFEVGNKLSGHWLFLQKPWMTDTLQFPYNLFFNNSWHLFVMCVPGTNQFAGICILKWHHHVRDSHCQVSTLASPTWGTNQDTLCCACF